MKPVYIMVGGFLGAGKTTSVARLARHYMQLGKRVGIVTNDQTTDLVDTHSLRSQGFDVGEVAGSCFCCNFDALTSTVEGLGDQELPEVILAEPVGSCTDLVATVIRPLTEVYGVPLDIAPYGVILKPSHGLRILKGDSGSGFSPKANYIFRKQIEEADFVIINRIDELPPEQVDELQALLESEYPGRPILRCSARTGEGFDTLVEMLEQRGQFGQRIMEVDYDVYAEGEAELGWLNSQVTVESDSEFALDELLVELIGNLHERLVATESEAAHLKVIGLSDASYAVANLVSNATGPELSLASKTTTKSANVVVNARVGTDPTELEQIVRQELATICQSRGLKHEVVSLQSFKPGRPVPTHRIV
ncbi:MAG: cobalamin biosynthesis protein P47K [Planctomycetaceae bacterium]|nr:cobalamin biosynthesis protein P47K [Planctomycetaceae bacterium]MCB9949975.1 cobalamin biosynthesis protein P47K [Planctomycetaceae bacterium]